MERGRRKEKGEEKGEGESNCGFIKNETDKYILIVYINPVKESQLLRLYFFFFFSFYSYERKKRTCVNILYGSINNFIFNH